MFSSPFFTQRLNQGTHQPQERSEVQTKTNLNYISIETPNKLTKKARKAGVLGRGLDFRHDVVIGRDVVGLQAGLKSLPHPAEELLESLSVLLAVEEWRFDARCPDAGPDGLQILLVGAEPDGDVLVLLTVASDELRAAEGR